uniref:hypothetical protein n=1 Tax=uncultured Ruegeria sp. TaxID=259304 RepID=UPI002607F839
LKNYTLRKNVGTCGLVNPDKKFATHPGAVIVFVDSKLPAGELAENEIIPTHLEVGATSIPTDVVRCCGWKYQFGAPYSCHDATQTGSVSSLARSNGQAFGVSCAHCLTGPDSNEHTANEISLLDRYSDERIPVGMSAYCFRGPGHGGDGDYGFADCGLFTITEEPYRSRALQGEALEDRQRVFRDEVVFAESHRGTKYGVVRAIEEEHDDQFVDLIIEVLDDGVFEGDSGILWRTENGAALGIHAMGR